MNKSEVFSLVSRRIDGCTKKDVETVLEVYADVVKDVLSNNLDEIVTLPGLGKFTVKQKPAKSGVSNLTGKAWEKPAKNELIFTVSSASKEV